MRALLINLPIFAVILSLGECIYLNPYSYGSYDPAAESPYYYQYYARYYNPNKHNPYAPYPTYMKPGTFRLPRMYQIDPSWAVYYPAAYGRNLEPNQGNSHFLRVRGRGSPESVAVFPGPDGCGTGTGTGGSVVYPGPDPSQVIFSRRAAQHLREKQRIRMRGRVWARARGSLGVEPKTQTETLLEDLDRQIFVDRRPKWSDSLPTEEQLNGFGAAVTLVRHRVPREASQYQQNNGYGGETIPNGVSGRSFGDNGETSSDVERLSLDRLSSLDQGGSGAHDGSTSNSDFSESSPSSSSGFDSDSFKKRFLSKYRKNRQ